MKKRQAEPGPCCPTCGRKFATRKPKADSIDRSTADMSTSELYAHYKATAPAEDVRFFARNAIMSDLVRAGVQALELAIAGQIPRAEVYRQLTALQDTWRRQNYQGSVVVPAARIERRRTRAAERQQIRKVAA